jgi:tRNA(Ile)-lysidine synthase
MAPLNTNSKSGAQQTSSICRRWRVAMRRLRFFEAGDRVGVAVSGGPDSTLLLHFMLDYAREAGFTLAVAHFNHHLRGAESDEDEEFVRALAKRLNLEFFCSGACVMELAREQKRNIESTARELRYRFFASLMSEDKLDKIATAHTANDQAETVLLRLLRGTGTRGLGGIHPVREIARGRVVRPFLSLTRAEVEAEVASRGIVFRTDATNLDTSLARNRVRQEVLPLLRRRFNPKVVRALAAFADRARDDESFLDAQARQHSSDLLVRAGDVLRMDCQRLNEFPPALARRVVRQAIEEMRASAVTHAEIESVRQLAADGQSGKTLPLAGGVEARREFGWLVFEKVMNRVASPEGRRWNGFSYTLNLPSDITVPELGLRLQFRLADMPDARTAKTGYTKNNGVWLDPGLLDAPLTLRNWRPGDRVDGTVKPLKLKRLFQRRGIPIGQRPYWPVLEAAGKIIWARGFEAPFKSRPSGGYRLLISEEQYQPDAGGAEQK